MPSFVCLCEEVTLDEVIRVINEEGIKDIETLKRRLRIGMGPCGGRYCINLILRLYPHLSGTSIKYKDETEIHVPTARPPTKPVSISLFEVGENNE